MQLVRVGAFAATVLAFAAAAPASACQIYGVEGFTFGTSVVRMVTPNGRPCAIRHYTHAVKGRSVRTVYTPVVADTERATRGTSRRNRDRMTYRGNPSDRFAYNVVNANGGQYDVDVTVTRR